MIMCSFKSISIALVHIVQLHCCLPTGLSPSPFLKPAVIHGVTSPPQSGNTGAAVFVYVIVKPPPWRVYR